MKLTFEAEVDAQPKPVQMRFGKESDLVELRRWRSPARMRANPHVSDALEYARLASKRWAYYPRKIIWDEATANSATFYEKILGAEFVFDQFHIQGETKAHCRRELARIHQPRP